MLQKTCLLQELEEELDAERTARNKAEKARQEMQNELEELGDRLDEAGGATQAQMELNKKRFAWKDFFRMEQDIKSICIDSTRRSFISFA